ncbi:MAG: DUF1592 domain-containing protein [Polyangiaceae bacterium]|nr:DUF1592 domain-containing protein [Polyangiaceae bacterium]
MRASRHHRWLPLLLILGPSVTSCIGGIGDPPDETTTSEAAIPPQPIHRLNRLEYNNTVRDLLGTSLRPADTFPPDGESDGFDNMADALQLTPTLLDLYFSSAKTVVDDGLDDRPAYTFAFGRDDLAVPGGYAVGDLWALSGNAIEVHVTVPTGGATVTLLAGASQIGPAPAPELRFELDGVPVETFVVAGTAAALEPRVHAVELAEGEHSIRYVPSNFINDAVANTSNNVLVASLDVQSNQLVEGPGRKLVFVCDPVGAPSCYDQVLATFAKRAWRRPLASDERAELTLLWQSLVDDGESDDEALRLVMRAILTSPKFLYRSRTVADADSDEWLDDYVLASRLSYFLWSSMPDERLMAAAEAGELSTEGGMVEAVTWMLADEKASGLRDGFAEQWLSTRTLALSSPSPEIYSSFDEELRDAMKEESKRFFGDFLENGLPVTALLEPDFAYLNDRLAEHYGLPAVGSTELVRVPASQTGRAGLLSLSAWLTAQSDAEHPSPIKRGLWVSGRVLCDPVPPPPAGLVIEPLPLDDDATVREQLEQHRSDPTCASCHSRLDVVGMGFQEYDGIGRRRYDPELDTLGQIPNGPEFEGADGFVDVMEDKSVFVGCVARKLYSYSLGRSIRSFDHEALDAVARTAVEEEYTLPQLIAALVLTPGFRAPARLEEE